MATTITIEVQIQAPLAKVWEAYTSPKHIVQWNHASDDWHSPRAENDLRPGGKFNYRMEAKDGSMGFDFGGTYEAVEPQKSIHYKIGDGRAVEVHFVAVPGAEGQTQVLVNFETEEINPIEMQRGGWQAILNNFKNHVESSSL